MKANLLCQCIYCQPGKCSKYATQEDLLCDICREVIKLGKELSAELFTSSPYCHVASEHL